MVCGDNDNPELHTKVCAEADVMIHQATFTVGMISHEAQAYYKGNLITVDDLNVYEINSSGECIRFKERLTTVWSRYRFITVKRDPYT